MVLGRPVRALERLLGGSGGVLGGIGEVLGVMLAAKMAANPQKI